MWKTFEYRDTNGGMDAIDKMFVCLLIAIFIVPVVMFVMIYEEPRIFEYTGCVTDTAQETRGMFGGETIWMIEFDGAEWFDFLDDGYKISVGDNITLRYKEDTRTVLDYEKPADTLI